MNLHAGNFRVGTDVTANYDSLSDGTSTWNINVQIPIQYFVIDRLSAGPILEYQAVHTSVNDQTTTLAGLGFEATWFFFRSGPVATFLEPQLFYERRSNGAPSTAEAAAALGGLWFFTPAVGFGAVAVLGFFYFAMITSLLRDT